ncbi:DUF1214 domain-containing protein [Lysobacter sp. MMG2]|nr:DUF1214 domain-containing protein [Lysobacter sp. MMG2]
MQHASPGPERESNWLPAPEDEFSLYIRAYWPDAPITKGRPAVTRRHSWGCQVSALGRKRTLAARLPGVAVKRPLSARSGHALLGDQRPTVMGLSLSPCL